jgi:hypothetical protein
MRAFHASRFCNVFICVHYNYRSRRTKCMCHLHLESVNTANRWVSQCTAIWSSVYSDSSMLSADRSLERIKKRQRQRDKEKEKGGVVRGTSYIWAKRGTGWRDYTLLQASQPSPARPCGKSGITLEWMQHKIGRKTEKKTLKCNSRYQIAAVKFWFAVSSNGPVKNEFNCLSVSIL